MTDAREGQNREEAMLLGPLMDLLMRSGRIRADTTLVAELPWHGRRVDLVAVTRTGIISAYELKLASIGRALEQATYNTLSFDRSWVVVNHVPSERNLQVARAEGLGVIVVQQALARVALPARLARNDAELRRRLLRKISERTVSRV